MNRTAQKLRLVTNWRQARAILESQACLIANEATRKHVLYVLDQAAINVADTTPEFARDYDAVDVPAMQVHCFTQSCAALLGDRSYGLQLQAQRWFSKRGITA